MNAFRTCLPATAVLGVAASVPASEQPESADGVSFSDVIANTSLLASG